MSNSNVKGPHLGILALVFTFLFNLGLYFVISFSANSPHFPGPWENILVIQNYFQTHSQQALYCAFFQFGAAVPLGIFTATMVSRLQSLGVKVPGVYISMFGGFMTSFNLAISALILWVMSYPEMAVNADVIRVLYYLMFAIGGVGYSVPLGLLIAGISVTSFFYKLIPRWLAFSGLGLAIVGELSFLSLIFPKLLFLIPLIRFPGFIWLILVGFKFPKNINSKN